MGYIFTSHFLVFVFSTVYLGFCPVSGHAYLEKPTPRSWIINNCGDRGDGVGIGQETIPGTNCGVCGDKFSLPKPRPHELGGTYGSGETQEVYYTGRVINVSVVVTNPHKGFLQWRICDNALVESDNQPCFDENLLRVFSATTKNMSLITVNPYQVDVNTYDRPDGNNLWVKAQLILPQSLNCERCVMQFNYRAGRTWKNFTASEMAQETFRGCSDIRIFSKPQFLENVALKLCLAQRRNSTSELAFYHCSDLNTKNGVASFQSWATLQNSPITFVSTGNCVDVSGGSKKEGASIIYWSCNRQLNQNWSTRMSKVDPAAFQLVSQLSGLCLTANVGDGEEAPSVVQSKCEKPDDDDSQLWRVVSPATTA